MPIGPNNRDQAERIGRQRRLVENARDDAEAQTLLAVRGYDARALGEGLALLAAAQTAYEGRDTASGSRTAAGKALAATDRDARDRLNAIRATLRALYAGQPEHLQALGVARERAAGDRDTFLTESRATLTAVQKAPYAAEAAAVGLSKGDVSAAEAAVEALGTAAGQHDSAEGSREGATDARDAAYADAQTWMTRYRRFARLAFADHPAVAERVGM